MSESTTAYPLSWPAGWPRTERRTRSAFSTTFSAARFGVQRELRLLGARDVVLSTNLPLKANGEPYAPTTRRKRQPWETVPEYSEPDDPGVAVYFTLDGEARCIPCDQWDRVKDNLRAIEKTIEALRGLERWGAQEIVNAAFAGFAALPAQTEGASWWRVLEVEHDAGDDEIEAAYRRLVKRHHPDVGGNPDAFRRVNEAYRQAMRRRPA